MRDELRAKIWKAGDEFALYADEALKTGDYASAGAALTIHRFLTGFAPNDRGETLSMAPKADAPVTPGEAKKRAPRKPKADAAAAAAVGSQVESAAMNGTDPLPTAAAKPANGAALEAEASP